MRAVTAEDLVHGRTLGFRHLLMRAEMLVDAALSTMHHPYVAFSGGKDSTVVQALVLRQSLVDVIWSDDELEYPETVTFIQQTAAMAVVGHATHNRWFTSWSDAPYWRDPIPGAIMIPGLMDDWSREVGYDGVFLGLRAQENGYRRIRTARFGHLHRAQHGQWVSTPIANWTADDVWAYIAVNDLPYNPVYDILTRIGVPRLKQRVGPIPLSEGWHLQQGWPEMYAALLARYGQRWSVM